MGGEGFILEDISVPFLQPGTFYFLMILSFFFHVFFMCVLSAFYDLHKVFVPGGGRINQMDSAALKTVFFFFVGVRLVISSSVLCLSTVGCLHFCLAPIGQTKILRDRAVSLVNSPQVSIYFEYLFIYFSGYFQCASFFFFSLVCFVFQCTAHALVQVLSVDVQRDTAPCKTWLFLKG